MRNWLCKRCGLATSADHTSGDCIATMRKRIAALEQESARLAASVLEYKAHPLYFVNADTATSNEVVNFSELKMACACGGTMRSDGAHHGKSACWFMSFNGGEGGSIGSTQGVS